MARRLLAAIVTGIAALALMGTPVTHAPGEELYDEVELAPAPTGSTYERRLDIIYEPPATLSVEVRRASFLPVLSIEAHIIPVALPSGATGPPAEANFTGDLSLTLRAEPFARCLYEEPCQQAVVVRMDPAPSLRGKVRTFVFLSASGNAEIYPRGLRLEAGEWQLVAQ